MVKTYIPPDRSDVVCPSCGAAIKAPASPRSRRVQCPKCREVVVIENLPAPPPEKKERTPAPPETVKESGRSDSLEARVAALEATVAALIVATPVSERPNEKKKLMWATAHQADPLQVFQSERNQALANNLGTAKPREIIIRAPAGDQVATERAVCFKEIFERAGWTVRGPEDVQQGEAGIALTLGVPELPVGKEAAETYLALKAAGFEPIPVLDSALRGGTDATVLSLTLPPDKPA
jgi:hypothetical protein